MFRASYFFFRTKNHFVVLVFILYIGVIIGFSFGYQSLIRDDLEKQPDEVANFIINPDIVAEKVRQNRFDLRVSIGVDSLTLLAVSQKRKVARQQLPLTWLSTITTSRNHQLYLNRSIVDSLRKRMSADRWQSYPNRLLHTADRGVQLSISQPITTSITFGHTLKLDRNDVLTSEMYLFQGVNRLRLSTLIRREDEDELDLNLLAGDNLLTRQIVRHDRPLISQQLSRIEDENLPLDDPKWRLYQELSQREQQVLSSLMLHRKKLARLVRPDWAYDDILFFTVVSLFANNYSDIYPNSTQARRLILAEFVLVWFLTICAVGLEPEKFGARPLDRSS